MADYKAKARMVVHGWSQVPTWTAVVPSLLLLAAECIASAWCLLRLRSSIGKSDQLDVQAVFLLQMPNRRGGLPYVERHRAMKKKVWTLENHSRCS